MIIVLDTNVLVSALAFPGGIPDRIFRAVLSGHFRNAVSPDTLSELRRVLEKVLGLGPDDIEALVAIVTQHSLIVYPTLRLKVVKKDDADNRILECALTARSNFLVTGDRKHLLPLKGWEGIHILSPRDFAEKFGIA